MKLLITKTAYQGQSSLPGITSNQQIVMVNNVEGVYCDVDNEQAFSQLNINKDSYTKTADGILIPKEML